jgi:CP family cyanate transporter-like MFS transporter
MPEDDVATHMPPESSSGDPIPASPSRRTAGRTLATAALVLAAFSLRPAITSLGPLLEEVRHGLGMSGTVAGLLTSAPALCFALFGTGAPWLARRVGPVAVVCGAMAAIALGLALRPLAGGTAVFLAVSALALAGIGMSNVLMPVVVKRYFPDRVGPVTGLYSMSLTLGSALSAGVTVPLTDALGGSWRLGLGAWALPAALAVLPWLALARERGAALPAPPAQTAGQAPAVRITRSRTAWALAVFFGLQATAAYIAMGWMPQIFRDSGVSAGTAGLLTAVSMGIGIPLSFALPAAAGRMRHQSSLVVVLGVFGLVGYGGLWLAPAAAPWGWAFLLGVSMSTFPLALTLIGMRSRTSTGVVRLSAFAQSTGYLISIPGPILVGTLYQHTGGWGLPIGFMTALLVPQVAAGVLAGRDRCVEDEL